MWFILLSLHHRQFNKISIPLCRCYRIILSKKHLLPSVTHSKLYCVCVTQVKWNSVALIGNTRIISMWSWKKGFFKKRKRIRNVEMKILNAILFVRCNFKCFYLQVVPLFNLNYLGAFSTILCLEVLILYALGDRTVAIITLSHSALGGQLTT